jgi:hypothetical protein
VRGVRACGVRTCAITGLALAGARALVVLVPFWVAGAMLGGRAPAASKASKAIMGSCDVSMPGARGRIAVRRRSGWRGTQTQQ